MRSPLRTPPAEVERWVARARTLRALDALPAWLGLWAGVAWALPHASAGASAVGAGLLLATFALLPWLRVRWRPVSGAVSLALSRSLRPGDRAWCVTPARAEPVVVTARRGWRLVVAGLGRDAAEGIEVRRTRVLVIPA